jgi:lysine 2,3-aminomutase
VVAGAEHFRTAVEKGVEIISALRGWTSGLGVPHYVIDAPGGGGKIPILPEYVQSVSATEVVLRNYAGEDSATRCPGRRRWRRTSRPSPSGSRRSPLPGIVPMDL